MQDKTNVDYMWICVVYFSFRCSFYINLNWKLNLNWELTFLTHIGYATDPFTQFFNLYATINILFLYEQIVPDHTLPVKENVFCPKQNQDNYNN